MASFALDSQLPEMHIFVAGDTIRFQWFVPNRFAAPGGECPFLQLVTLHACNIVLFFEPERIMAEPGRLESGYVVTGFAFLSELTEVRIAVTVAALGERRQFPFSCRMALRAGNIGVQAGQRKLLVLYVGVFPAFCVVASGTIRAKSSVVLVRMAGCAVREGKSFVHFVLMARCAGHFLMQARQRIFCAVMIEGNLLHRSIYGVASFALWQPALMLVLVAGNAIRVQTQERSGFVTGSAVLDGRMQSFQHPSCLGMIESFRVHRADVEILSQMFAVAFHTVRCFVRMITVLCCDLRCQVFMTLEAL